MLRRLALQIRSTRRSPAPVVPPTQPLLLCRFSHIVVVLTNVLQLVLMLSFLVTLLLQLNQTIQVSWFVVFITLWASDSITFVMGVLEFYHLAIAPEDRCAGDAPSIPTPLPAVLDVQDLSLLHPWRSMEGVLHFSRGRRVPL